MINTLKFSRELNCLFLSIFCFAIALGINLVTFPTVLTLHHVDPAHIGLASSCDVVGGAIASFFLARFVAKLGIMRALMLSSIAYAASISLIYFYQNFWLWASFILFMGCCWFIYVITRQSWLNILLSNEQRGVATGVFSMIISAGTALGPVIVKHLGAADYRSFLASSFFVILSYFFVSLLKNLPQPSIESKRIKLIEFFTHNRRAFITRLFLDFQCYAFLAFTVVFGVNIGLSYEAAGLLITAYMASGFFDVFVGFLLKNNDPYRIINIGFLGSLICFSIIAIHNESYPLLIVLYFVLGMFMACIYVSVFKVTNEDYSKEKLVAANSTFQIVGSIGSLLGALVGGLAINTFGAQGFPIIIISSSVIYLIFLITYEKKYSKQN